MDSIYSDCKSAKLLRSVNLKNGQFAFKSVQFQVKMVNAPLLKQYFLKGEGIGEVADSGCLGYPKILRDSNLVGSMEARNSDQVGALFSKSLKFLTFSSTNLFYHVGVLATERV